MPRTDSPMLLLATTLAAGLMAFRQRMSAAPPTFGNLASATRALPTAV